jgi:hypothetical protein
LRAVPTEAVAGVIDAIKMDKQGADQNDERDFSSTLLWEPVSPECIPPLSAASFGSGVNSTK